MFHGVDNRTLTSSPSGKALNLIHVCVLWKVNVHRGEHVARAQKQLREMIRDLLTEAAETGDLREDVAPDELASYCLHALTAASSLPSKAAVRRLVTVTLAGLRPRA